LEKLIAKFPGEAFTYWLDGHYSGGDTGKGVKESPLLQELEVILKRNLRGEMIYIDDMRLYRAFDSELHIDAIQDLIARYAPHSDTWTESTIHDQNDILVIST
jgi:hypothetical protein